MPGTISPTRDGARPTSPGRRTPTPASPSRWHEPRVKSPEIIERMRRAGARRRRGAAPRRRRRSRPGVTTDELDAIVPRGLPSSAARYPSPLNYNGFPKSRVHVGQRGHLPRHPRRPARCTTATSSTSTSPIYLDGVHGDTNATFFVGDVDDESRAARAGHRGVPVAGHRRGAAGPAGQRHRPGHRGPRRGATASAWCGRSSATASASSSTPTCRSCTTTTRALDTIMRAGHDVHHRADDHHRRLAATACGTTAGPRSPPTARAPRSSSTPSSSPTTASRSSRSPTDRATRASHRRRRRRRRPLPHVRRARRLRRDASRSRLLRCLRRAAHRRSRRGDLGAGSRPHVHDRPRHRGRVRGHRGAARRSSSASTSTSSSATSGGFARMLAGDSQLRWIGPEKGAIHLATAALVNAAWDLRAKREGKPLWRLLADLSPEELVELIDFTYLTDMLTPASRRRAAARSRSRTRADRIAELERDGYPAYTTSAGWLGLRRRQDPRALPRGGRRRVQRDQDEGRRGPRRRHAARRAAARASSGPDRLADDRRQPAMGRRPGDRMDARARPIDPYWIEEPTSPDDVLGHAAIARGVAPDQGRHRRARAQPRDVQAAAAGRRDRRVPGRRVPARRRQRGARRSADGGESRRPGVPARGWRRAVRVRVSTSRRSTTSRCRARSTAASASWPTTCTSTSPTRCRCEAAGTCCRARRATASTMRPDRSSASAFPTAPCGAAGGKWPPQCGGGVREAPILERSEHEPAEAGRRTATRNSAREAVGACWTQPADQVACRSPSRRGIRPNPDDLSPAPHETR